MHLRVRALSFLFNFALDARSYLLAPFTVILRLGFLGLPLALRAAFSCC
jgi:hypothetical protein